MFNKILGKAYLIVIMKSYLSCVRIILYLTLGLYLGIKSELLLLKIWSLPEIILIFSCSFYLERICLYKLQLSNVEHKHIFETYNQIIFKIPILVEVTSIWKGYHIGTFRILA